MYQHLASKCVVWLCLHSLSHMNATHTLHTHRHAFSKEKLFIQNSVFLAEVPGSNLISGYWAIGFHMGVKKKNFQIDLTLEVMACATLL